jgi:hypothetical protein
MLGRVYGIVYGGDQLALIGSSVIAAPLVALADARVAFVIAGVGALARFPGSGGSRVTVRDRA